MRKVEDFITTEHTEFIEEEKKILFPFFLYELCASVVEILLI
jgi:hypothetical protein